MIHISIWGPQQENAVRCSRTSLSGTLFGSPTMTRAGPYVAFKITSCPFDDSEYRTPMFLLPGLALGNPGPNISQLTEPLTLAAWPNEQAVTGTYLGTGSPVVKLDWVGLKSLFVPMEAVFIRDKIWQSSWKTLEKIWSRFTNQWIEMSFWHETWALGHLPTA